MKILFFKVKRGNEKGKSNIAPLQPPTLARFRTWGIQQELVVPICRCKDRQMKFGFKITPNLQFYTKKIG
jgi:hypothetical protein